MRTPHFSAQCPHAQQPWMCATEAGRSSQLVLVISPQQLQHAMKGVG